MSRPPEPYTPTSTDVLLQRTRARSTALRRRRRLAGGGSLVLVVGLVVGVVVGASGPGRSLAAGRLVVTARTGAAEEVTADVARARGASASTRIAVEKAEGTFSLRLLDELQAADGSHNVLVSPSSLATALAMLELGSAGQTERQIAATLRTAGLTPAQQASGWNALTGLLSAETSTSRAHLRTVPQLDIANGLWIQKSLPVRQHFVDALTSEFGTGVWRVNFAGDLAGAVRALNRWASQHTDGLIRQMFSKGGVDQSTALVLANAVYFHAQWKQAFEARERRALFHLGSGGQETVPYMASPPSASRHALAVPFSVGAGYEAVELPYAGKHLSALVVMPETESLSAFTEGLSATRLTGILHHLSVGTLDLKMPSFTIRADNLLDAPLGAMGMPDAFGSADFSGISPVGLAVQTVEQHAYLQVTPQGTTAAAVTGVAMATSTRRTTAITIDHPFLFLIRDDTTGTVLFEAMVENPLGP